MERNTGPSGGTPEQLGAAALRAAWTRLPVLPVLRVSSPDNAVRSVALLAAAGIEVVELTATTPDWSSALDRVRAEHPGLIVGLGTVRDTETARRAVGAGADFLVSPHPVPEVRAAVPADTTVIEGGWTPDEVARASDSGIAKLFPAHVGGPAYLSSLRAVLPSASIVPTGGIDLEDTADWLDAGALAVGVGSALVDRLATDAPAVTDWLSGLERRR